MGVEGKVFPPDFSAASKRIKEIIFNLPILQVGLFAQILTNSCEPHNLTLTHFHSPPQHPALPYSFHKLSFIHAIFGSPPFLFSCPKNVWLTSSLALGQGKLCGQEEEGRKDRTWRKWKWTRIGYYLQPHLLSSFQNLNLLHFVKFCNYIVHVLEIKLSSNCEPELAPFSQIYLLNEYKNQANLVIISKSKLQLHVIYEKSANA
jgi:hypothetical protein